MSINFIGSLPETLAQELLVGNLLVGGLGVLTCPTHVFLKTGESLCKLWCSLTQQQTRKRTMSEGVLDK